jgi:hypothetical protein
MGVRRLVTVVGPALAGLALVVASAGPAAAKGPTGMTITYPGGGPPVDVGKDRGGPGIGALTEDLGLWSALGDTAAPPLSAEPPVTPVGEPFTVRWTMYHDTGTPLVITQQLWLGSDGGGLVYTEAGQDAEPYAVGGTTGGWLQVPESLRAHLEAAGFDPASAPPVAAPAAKKTADEARASDGAATNSWWAPVGLAAAAAVGATALAAATAVRRGRRARDAAPAAG